MTFKAIIFDFIGTLTNVKGYSMEDSKLKLCETIIDAGFDVGTDCFLDAYSKAHEKYRLIRYQELVEVTNAVWISEALNSLGFKTTPKDECVKTAVNLFFEDYVKSLRLRPCARGMLKKLAPEYTLGLISNFTYAPVIYAGLRKLGINQYFDAVLVSDEIGWRKPNQKIFKEALRRLGVKAQETLYVGDSPNEDIKGAQEASMQTIFVPSQFYTIEELVRSQQEPDIVVKDICEFCKRFSEISRRKSL